MIEVTAGIIKNKEGQMLITRRKEGLHLAGFWEFPGGKIEPNETPETCLKREIIEELNIVIHVKHHITDSIYDYSGKLICLKGYYAKFISGNIELTDHDAYRWISIHECDQFTFAPADIPIIKAMQNGI